MKFFCPAPRPHLSSQSGQVGLLLMVEIGAVPMLAGFWLHICSLEVRGATLASLRAIVQHSPLCVTCHVLGRRM